ncbi:retrotransposon protein, putative, ty1-copia subclass [Tanacetum coccineum]
MGKTVGELHAMLNEYKKGLPKKAETPQVMMIKGGKIQKSNKKSLKAKGKGKANGKGKDKQVYIPKPKNPKPSAKEHPAKDDTCHRTCIEGFRIEKKLKRGSLYLYVGNGVPCTVEAIRSFELSSPPYTPQHNGVSERRNRTLLDMVRSMMNLTTLPLSFWDYALESATRILNMVTKEERLISQEISGRAVDLEEIQEEEDTTPSEITSNIPQEVEGFEPPHEEVIPIRSYKSRNVGFKSNKWIDAMNAEIQSMMDNMQRVYTQLYGVDYEETFSPVADIRAISISISIASYYDYVDKEKDITTAFLMVYLIDTIYMVQPEGFVDPNHPRKVCKLQRSIYGLKQASRSWNKRFDEEIKSLQSVKDYLGKCFAMKDLGEAAFILGIKIYRDRSKRLIGLCQNAYMDKILKRYKMDNSKRGHIPMQERLDLNKSTRRAQPPNGGATRPDVLLRGPKMTSRFQQNPGEPHWTAVKNILKYLRNTKDMFLVYGGNPSTELRVECYCDAGFETDRDDTKSQTGYVFVLNGGAVDWKSSKQSTTAMSLQTESEYIAASEAAMEAVWIRKFISGLGIVPTINEPLNMY